MINLFRRSGFIPGLASILLLTGNVFAQETIVVNTNGSFEEAELSNEADTLDIDGWTIETFNDAQASYAIVDDTVKDGSRAMRIDVTTLGTNAWDIQVINEVFPVEDRISYTFSMWAKASGTGTISLSTGNPDFVEFARIGEAEVTEEWQEYTFAFSVEREDTEGRAPIHFSYDGNEGLSFWIDSLRISYEKTIEPPTSAFAYGKAKWLGNVYSSDQAPLFANYWNQVTPENDGKWGSVEGSRDNMNWTNLDAAYNLAKNNGLPFRFHVLVWGNQQPVWMKGLNEEEQLEEIQEWFEAVAERYQDIDYLEVVNEPLHDPPTSTGSNENDQGSGGYYEALGGAGETGYDWIITAFEMARDIFPVSTKLIINDYGIISNATAVRQYKNIINLLKERGLIDGIGVQAHAFNNGSSIASGTTPGTIRSNLNSLAELNLPIQATEMDIDAVNNQGMDNEAYQLEQYKRIFPVFWEHPAVIGVTLWGWKPGLWRSQQEAWIFDQRPRDAMDWLEDYVDTANVVVDVSIEDEITDVPAGFELDQNYPNPFNPTTQISFSLPVNSMISLKVYDITGREITTLVDRQMTAGDHQVTFNASSLASGVYIYRLQAGDNVQTKRMLLIK